MAALKTPARQPARLFAAARRRAASNWVSSTGYADGRRAGRRPAIADIRRNPPSHIRCVAAPERAPAPGARPGFALTGALAIAAAAAWAALSLDARWWPWAQWLGSGLLGAASAWLAQRVSAAIALRPAEGIGARAALLRLCWAWLGRWLVVGALAAAAFLGLGGLHASSYAAGLVVGLALCAAGLARRAAGAERRPPRSA